MRNRARSAAVKAAALWPSSSVSKSTVSSVLSTHARSPGSECEDVLRAYCLSLKENRSKIVDLGGKYQISIYKSQLSNGLMLFHLFYDMQLGIVLCYRARLPFR